MNKFILILVIHAIIAITPRSMAKVNNDKLIDFWTNSYNEIILHFRYNKNTHELEMQQQNANELNNEVAHSKIMSGKDLGKGLRALNDKRRQKPKEKEKDIKSNVNETPKDTFLIGVDLSSISPGLKVNVLKIKPQVTSPAAVTTEWVDKVKTTVAEKDTEDKKMKSREATGTIAFSIVNPLSIEACSLNCSKEPHIACGNSWTFANSCSPRTTILNLDSYQELLLRLHNDNRNELAGNLTQFEPATHMATMQWHNELAEYALLNALKCEVEHDWCHNTKQFQRTGQNLAWKSWTNRRTSIETILEQMVYDWYREHQYARQTDLDSYQGNGLDNEVISHFTTMVNERNTHMGCGAIQMKEGKKKSLFLTCNYARNNVFDAPIYVKGPTASQCQTGINPDYSNLCSIDELYDYNN